MGDGSDGGSSQVHISVLLYDRHPVVMLCIIIARTSLCCVRMLVLTEPVLLKLEPLQCDGIGDDIGAPLEPQSSFT